MAKLGSLIALLALMALANSAQALPLDGPVQSGESDSGSSLAVPDSTGTETASAPQEATEAPDADIAPAAEEASVQTGDDAAFEAEETSVRPDTAPAPPAQDAGVQFMVTNKMKAQLEALGYLEEEIAQLQPERAAAIIARSIARPSRGVPKTWMRRQPFGGLRKLISSTPVSSQLEPAAVGLLDVQRHKTAFVCACLAHSRPLILPM